MAAARRKAVHQKMAKALIRAVAELHPDVAAEGMSALALVERNGLRRRALRAAQILLIRKAMEAPPPVAEVVPDVPEPEPAILEAPPLPKPAPKGVLKTINLDDVARMLMASEPEPEVTAPVVEAPAEPEFVPLSWATDAEDAPQTANEPPDLAAEFAALMAADDPEAESPAPVQAEAPALTMDLSALSLLEEPAPEASAVGVAEADALFAALEDEGDGRGASPAPGVDLSALSLLEEPAREAGAVGLAEADALFRALEQADAPPVPDTPATAARKPMMIDLSAQFAAMSSDEEGSPKG